MVSKIYFAIYILSFTSYIYFISSNILTNYININVFMVFQIGVFL